MRTTRVGFAATALMGLAAAWVFFAPFIVGYQPRGGHWVTATRDDLAAGGAIAVAALAGLVTVAALTIRDLRRRAHTRSGQWRDR
jgi:cytochrome c oxidase assembly factor CtaG